MRLVLPAAALAIVFALSAGPARPAGTALGYCGTAAAPSGYDHVIVIVFENRSYSQVIGSASAPFMNELASSCGLATNYRNLVFPSLPNYLYLTSGSKAGVTAGCVPGPSCQSTQVSIFEELEQAGKTWRDYQEDMPSNCTLLAAGRYDVEHNPAAYYTRIASTCATNDVPMGTTAGGNLAADLANDTLPNFAFVVPNVCDAAEKTCGNADPLAVADAWLKGWMQVITTSPAYLAERTAVFITFDNAKVRFGKNIPTFVVSPSTAPATRAADLFSHCSTLRTAADLLGVAPPNCAATANSMRTAFGL
jgi:phospholipase C